MDPTLLVLLRTQEPRIASTALRHPGLLRAQENTWADGNPILRQTLTRHTDRRNYVGATTIGALIGAGIDSLSGDDGNADGAIIGAITANVLKIVVPLAVTYAIGWAVLRGAAELKDQVFGESEA